MIRAVIFDCFGVLHVDASHAFYEKYVPNYGELRPRLIELNTQSDYGLISQDEWKEQVAEATGLDIALVRREIQGQHQRNEELIEYVGKLRAQGLLVGMLSNIGTGAMDQFFSPEERRERFDAVVLSSEVGLTKPHPEIFKLMAERLGVATGECVMIDDLAANCEGADAVGMKSIHFTTNETLKEALSKLL